MSQKKNSFSYEKLVKDEYECELYGFPLRHFAKENFVFVEERINKTLEDLEDHFMGLLKEQKPELREKIKTTCKSVSKKILESCHADIKNVNNVTIQNLSIPENVLLLNDKPQMQQVTLADEHKLREDCESLNNVMRENALFIQTLKNELECLHRLEEARKEEDIIFSKVEELLKVVPNFDLSLNTLKKIKDLPE